jgi:hypothetical protein
MAADSPSDLSRLFETWLLPGRALRDEAAAIVDRAALRKGAEQDFATAALLGFAADAGLLSKSQLGSLRTNLLRLAGRSSVIHGSPMAFCGDAVGVLGVVVGAKKLADSGVAGQIEQWAASFLKSSYGRDGLEEWQRCLFAVAGRHLGNAIELEIPVSPAIADVRTALRSKALVEAGDGDLSREESLRVLNLALRETEADLGYDRAVLRLAALDYLTESGNAAGSDPVGTPRKRGRPIQIDIETKEAALAVKARGGKGTEIARILYKTKYPTVQQVKNVSNILKNYLKVRVSPPTES